MQKQYKIVSAELHETWEPWQGNDGGFTIHWEAEDIGFGELSFYIKNGETFCDNECMSEEFCEVVMKKFLKGITFI